MTLPVGIPVSLGSMPGASPTEAMSIVIGETALPHIVELPARGPGADMIGRTFSMLNAIDSSVSVEPTPSGWRVARGMNSALSRAASWLNEDRAAFELVMAGSDFVKVQVCGPFTLAASVEPVVGDRLLQDAGARADLLALVTEAAAAEVEWVRRRCGDSRVVVQIDEPALVAVLAGSIPTRSGRGRVAPVEASEVASGLALMSQRLRALGAVSALHCCADRAPLKVLGASGFDVWSLPASAVDVYSADPLSEHLESGGAWWIGMDLSADVVGLVRRTQRLALDISMPPLAKVAAISPTCGLAFEPRPERVLKAAAQVMSALNNSAEDEVDG